tara:strand:+ start:384 stop:653 length:270 start_codon:yes stop_codon:yes gene_type:complete
MTNHTQNDKIKVNGNDVQVFVERIYCADYPKYKNSEVVALNRLGAMVTLDNTPKPVLPAYKVGDKIIVDSREFTIGSAPNNNYTLESAQ